MLNDGLTKREVLGDAHIPYVRHINPQTIALKDGALLSMVEVGGLPHECADMSEINAQHRMLNGLWLNLADERVALWSILIRRRVQSYQRHAFDNPFVDRLDARHGEHMNSTALYRNRMFLAVLRRPSADPFSIGTAVLRKSIVPLIDDGDVEDHRDKVLAITSGLAALGTRTLGLIENSGLVFSEIATVLHWMLGGRQEAVPLTMGPIWSAAYQDRLVFGREALEIRHPERTDYAGIFGFKEYPSTTRPTMSDELLTAPMELMAVHSFCFKAKAAARDLMTKRINQIASSRDNARKQVPLVAHAIEELADNKFCMGEHQGSVTIFADSHKALADKMAQARSYLMHGGAIVVSYAVVTSPETADRISKQAGECTVEVQGTSERSNWWFGLWAKGAQSQSRMTYSTNLQKRPLILPHEVREMRRDEQIIFVAAKPALRCGRAIFFRRPEMLEGLGKNKLREGAAAKPTVQALPVDTTNDAALSSAFDKLAAAPPDAITDDGAAPTGFEGEVFESNIPAETPQTPNRTDQSNAVSDAADQSDAEPIADADSAFTVEPMATPPIASDLFDNIETQFVRRPVQRARP